MPVSKKRVIKSLEGLNEDLRELLRTQYPNGYEASISRIANAKNEPIFVFPLETDDATYLIKVPTTKNSEGDYEMEKAADGEFAAVPPAGDDDFDNSSNDDFEENGESDYDEEDGGERRGNREASYDPDFDN